MNDFIFKCPTKIIFGKDKALEIHHLIEDYGCKKLLVVTDKTLEKTESFLNLVSSLKQNAVNFDIYSDVVPEPPIQVIDKAAAMVREADYDVVLAVGGGSPIDTSKAICMLKTNEGSARDYMFGGSKTVRNQPIPLICVPTTAGSGSEVTAASVISDEENKIKLSITHELIIPRIAVIDPVMQKGMPMHITASTGMDALTHAIEAYTSLNASELSDMYALKAMELVGKSLRTAAFNPDNLEARSDMAIASVLGAAAFSNGGLGMVHGISQAMGGIAHVPHGVANSMMLPYVIEHNIKGNYKKFAKVAEILGEKTNGLSTIDAAYRSIHAVKKLAEDLKIPDKLREVHVTKEMFQEIIKGTMEYRLLGMNPVPVNEKMVGDILEKAY